MFDHDECVGFTVEKPEYNDELGKLLFSNIHYSLKTVYMLTFSKLLTRCRIQCTTFSNKDGYFGIFKNIRTLFLYVVYLWHYLMKIKNI